MNKPILVKILTPLFLLSIILGGSYLIFSSNDSGANLGIVLPKVAQAGTSADITGYAWSDNIGWISFQGSNYGVSMDSSHQLSGYAWSDNIGWISFNSSDLSGCPSGTCEARLSGSSSGGWALEGWARALAGTQTSDGWDGWIHLSGSNYGITLQSNGVLDGFVWGSSVVGWVDFNASKSNTKLDAASPTSDINASSASIQKGVSPTISWNSSNAESCTGDCVGDNDCNFSTGGATSGSTATVSLTESTTYSIHCENILGEIADDVVVVNVKQPQLSISADPQNIRRGETTTIEWSAQNVESCEVNGPNGTLATGTGPSSAGTEEIEGKSVYTLKCQTKGGVTESTSVTVTMIPEWEEF